MVFAILRAAPCQAQATRYQLEYVSDSACPAQAQFESLVDYLRLRPGCTATLGQLDDCVETIRAGGGGVVGHGCGPLLANPTCKNVIVQPWTPRPERGATPRSSSAAKLGPVDVVVDKTAATTASKGAKQL